MKKITLAIGLSLLGSAAFAGNSEVLSKENVYVFGGIGATEFNDLNAQSFIGGANFDTSDTAIHAGIGLELSENLAVEFAHADLGNYTFTNAPGTSFSAQGTSISLVGIVPVAKNWNVTGNIGIASTRLEHGTESSSNTAGKFGLGVQYNINQNFNIGANWDRFTDFGNTDFKLDNVSVRVTYGF